MTNASTKHVLFLEYQIRYFFSSKSCSKVFEITARGNNLLFVGENSYGNGCTLGLYTGHQLTTIPLQALLFNHLSTMLAVAAGDLPERDDNLVQFLDANPSRNWSVINEPATGHCGRYAICRRIGLSIDKGGVKQVCGLIWRSLSECQNFLEQWSSMDLTAVIDSLKVESFPSFESCAPERYMDTMQWKAFAVATNTHVIIVPDFDFAPTIIGPEVTTNSGGQALRQFDEATALHSRFVVQGTQCSIRWDQFHRTPLVMYCSHNHYWSLIPEATTNTTTSSNTVYENQSISLSIDVQDSPDAVTVASIEHFHETSQPRTLTRKANKKSKPTTKHSVPLEYFWKQMSTPVQSADDTHATTQTQTKRARGRPRSRSLPSKPKTALLPIKCNNVASVQPKTAVGQGMRTMLSASRYDDAMAHLLSIPRQQWNIKRTARNYQVEPSGLRYRIRRLQPAASCQPLQLQVQAVNTALSKSLENEISAYLCNMAYVGFALRQKDLRNIARSLAIEAGIENFNATRGWVWRFMRRHPELKYHVLQEYNTLRASGSNPVMIRKYFHVLQWAIHECERRSGGVKMTPNRIANIDETGFHRGATRSWAIVPKNTRTYRAVAGSVTFHVTMVNYILASGVAGAPFFIMQGKRHPTASQNKLTPSGHLKGVSTNCQFEVQESGFLTTEMWESRVVPFLCQDIRSHDNDNEKELWRLVILDGVGAHTLSAIALRHFTENRMLVVKLPGHTSADLQPLDVSCYHPVKSHYRDAIRDEFISNYADGGRNMDQWDLPQILEQCWYQGASSTAITAGFRKCGIWPLNTNWIHDNVYVLATSISFMRSIPSRAQLPALIFGPTTGKAILTLAQLDKVAQFLELQDLTQFAKCSRLCKVEIRAVLTAREQCHEDHQSSFSATISRNLAIANGQTMIDKAVAFMELQQLPSVCSKIGSNQELLHEVSILVSRNLGIAATQILQGLQTSLDLTGDLLQHLRLPSKMASIADAHARKRSRKNQIGESEADPQILNDESRVQRIEAVKLQRDETTRKLHARKTNKRSQFLRELPIAKRLKASQVISWDPTDADAYNSSRLVTKRDLTLYMRKRNFGSTFQQSVNHSVTNATRDELATFLLNKEQMTNTRLSISQNDSFDNASDDNETGTILNIIVFNRAYKSSTFAILQKDEQNPSGMSTEIQDDGDPHTSGKESDDTDEIVSNSST